MNTMYKQTPALSIGRRSLITKVAQTFLALAMLAVLAAPVQPTVNSIGEEIPTPRRPVTSSIGEEIPTPRRPVASSIGEEIPTPRRPVASSIGEEIPQVAYHPCNSCGEEIPQVVNLSGKEIVGGVAGRIV